MAGMFTQKEVRIDDTYYQLCAAFSYADRLWKAYILSEGEWVAYVGMERCADAALNKCADYLNQLKGVNNGNLTNHAHA